jgi:hypothetical protein
MLRQRGAHRGEPDRYRLVSLWGAAKKIARIRPGECPEDILLRLADQICVSSNRLITWLRQIESLRIAA